MVGINDGRIRSCPRVGWGKRGTGGKGGKGYVRLRIGSWNISTLTWKSIKLAKIFQKRKINIVCVQQTRLVGSRARDEDGFQLWYSGYERGKNMVGILIIRDLRVLVVKVRRVKDKLMAIKLVVGGYTLNVSSTYVA